MRGQGHNMIWKEIYGYKFRYRINDDGKVQKFDSKRNVWVDLSVKVAERATVSLRTKEGKQVEVGVSRLMDQAFFGGYAQKNGLKAAHRNASKADCSRGNLIFLNQSQLGRWHGGRGEKKARRKVRPQWQ